MGVKAKMRYALHTMDINEFSTIITIEQNKKGVLGVNANMMYAYIYIYIYTMDIKVFSA